MEVLQSVGDGGCRCCCLHRGGRHTSDPWHPARSHVLCD